MKKIFVCLAVFCLALTLATCNSATGGTKGGGEGDGEEVIFEPKGTYTLSGTGDYPGAEITLPTDLLDISNYASVTVTAKLYTDDEGTSLASSPSSSSINFAQFKLLKATGGWDDNSNLCGITGNNTKYNMVVDGPTTWTVPAGASGIPTKLLLQANHANDDGVKVVCIGVSKIVFTPKTSDIVLDHIYGTSAQVAGNKIIFENAAYSNNASGSDGGVGHAVLFAFPSTFPTTLTGKTLVFEFKLEDIDAEKEHQLHIQAAENTPAKDMFNGRNTQPGQKYITLDKPEGAGNSYNAATKTGVFTISCDDMIAAAAVSGSADDYKGPFTLNAVRIVNNGTVWTDTSGDGATHTREKSYTLIFTSITVK